MEDGPPDTPGDRQDTVPPSKEVSRRRHVGLGVGLATEEVHSVVSIGVEEDILDGQTENVATPAPRLADVDRRLDAVVDGLSPLMPLTDLLNVQDVTQEEQQGGTSKRRKN